MGQEDCYSGDNPCDVSLYQSPSGSDYGHSTVNGGQVPDFMPENWRRVYLDLLDLEFQDCLLYTSDAADE